MKRRSFLMSMAAAVLPVVRFAPTARLAAPARIALYDSALPRGRALARQAARAGIAAVSLREAGSDDIGMLWHLNLANRTGEQTIALCALRASDRFVLERFTRPHGLILIDT